MSANEHINELLSGFLDGELSADELRELDVAMAEDAGLRETLDQFRQLSMDLRSLPKQGLGSDFADRVLAVACREAQERGGSATSSVRDEQVVDGRVLVNRDSGRWPTVSAMAGLAATLLLAVYLSGWFAVPGNGLSQIPAGGKSTNLPEQGPKMADASEEADSSFVRSDPKLKQRMKGQVNPSIMPILEVLPTPEAWKQNLVAKVLIESGIAWSTPIQASNELVDVLNETRSINRGLVNQQDDEIAIILVKAQSSKIDEVSMKMWNRISDFPSMFFDMAFDLPGKDLVQKLASAQLLAADSEKPIATPVVVSARSGSSLGEVAEFSSAPRARYASKEERGQPIALPVALPVPGVVGSEDEDEITYLLLVIRKPGP